MHRTRLFASLVAITIGLCVHPPAAVAQTRVAAAVDASKTREPITKYMYGMFIEHLGNLIDRGLWAEMLDDRKFYHPVNSKPLQPPVLGMRLDRRREPRRWRPIGPDESVLMDTAHRYTGDHSPLVGLSGATPLGIQQSGIALRKGKAYTGRVVLAADPGAKVTVSLVWGPGATDRQTVSVGSRRTTFAKYPLNFVAGADTQDGRLEIAGTGKGTFRIGAVSLMPADNIHGFRADTIALLRQLNSGFYRFPGGNFLSNHDWKDAIGDIDQRPPTWDYHWSAVQPNDVGIDEFMVLCGLLGVEPYVTVNSGFGEARAAAEQVEYANGSVETPWGKLRAAHGHPAPYHIKFWNIGNEMYGWWQLGHMALNQYLIKHNMFAQAMREKDPTITILASGATPDEMTVTTNSRRITGKVLTEFGSPADWSGGLLAYSLDYLDGLAEHWYCHSGLRFDLDRGQNGPLGVRAGFVPVEEPFVDSLRRGANRVRCKAEAWEEYQKRFPAMKEKKVFVSMDEWSYGRPSLRNAVSIAWVFHEMFRHTDFIKMSAYTFATSCINYDATHAAFNTTGLVFKLYRDHYGTIPVEVTGNSPPPAPKWPVGGDQPSVNAGSPTFPVDVAAAFTGDRERLTVSVINPTESAQELSLSFQAVGLSGKGRVWRMVGPKPDASNELDQKPQVEITEDQISEVPGTLQVAPNSINLFEFETR